MANVVCMNKRPLSKGQGHSFWYQSISNNTTSYRLPIVTFALGP